MVALHRFANLDLFFDLCRFTDSVAQIVQLASADFTGTDKLNLCHIGRIHGEYSLNADAVGNAANGKGFGNAAAFDRDDSAFKHRNSFSFPFADCDMYLDNIANLNVGSVFLNHAFGHYFECVHFQSS